MKKAKWNRKAKRTTKITKADEIAPFIAAQEPYVPTRLRPRKRRPKHEGFTTVPKHRLWIFENNK